MGSGRTVTPLDRERSYGTLRMSRHSSPSKKKQTNKTKRVYREYDGFIYTDL